MNSHSSLFSHKKDPVDIDCPHFSECPGCTKNNPLYPTTAHFLQAQRFIKLQSSCKELLHIETGKSTGWRTRARLAIRSIGKHVRCGLYQKKSHNLVAIPDCKAHHPSINSAIAIIESTLTSLKELLKKQLIYDENQHRGLLRYIQCTVERCSGKVQVAFIINSSIEEIEKPHNNSDFNLLQNRLKDMYENNKSLIHSIWFNSNTNRTNVITGESWSHFVGEKAIWESIASRRIPFLPFHFEQANLEMFEKLVLDIKEQEIQDCENIVELYAGMGAIGLLLKEKARQVISIESSLRAQETYELAVRESSQEEQIGLQFISGDSEIEYKKLLLGKDCHFQHILVVDPPRKGLSLGLTNLLIELAKNKIAPKKLIYISCHYPSLERDAERLIQEGGWKVLSARSYLFFPGTDHIETVFSFVPV